MADTSIEPITRTASSPVFPVSSTNGNAKAGSDSTRRTDLSIGDRLHKASDSVETPTSPGLATHAGVAEAIQVRHFGHGAESPISPSKLEDGAASPGVLPSPPLSSPTSSRPPASYIGKTTGTSTPPNRRSVQFVRSDTDPTHSRLDNGGNEEDAGKERKGTSLISKLKALSLSATTYQPTHTRSASAGANQYQDSSPPIPSTPGLDGPSTQLPNSLQEYSDEDADAEETADEELVTDAAQGRMRPKRRTKRPKDPGSQPTTPRVRSTFESLANSASRPTWMIKRRATMPDRTDEQRGGLSEGEGRDRLGKENARRRASAWSRGQSYNGPGILDGEPVPLTTRKSSNFRSGMGLGGQSDGDGAVKRPFLGGDRAATFGAQRWRMLKHSLKLLGQKKEEHRVDYLKSAELMAELRAGAPAALILASMIQRDEHGNKRIPVLLEQLKLRVTDSKSVEEGRDSKEGKEAKDSERHLVFRIELEYGSGLNRMKWVIYRSLRDFFNLHVRYKLQASSDKYIQLRSDLDSRPKQPRFPKSSFPYLRGVRGLGDSEDDDDNIRAEDTVGEATASETDRIGKKKKTRRPSLSTASRWRSSVLSVDPETNVAAGVPGQGALAQNRKAYNERQRRKLEQYLQEMIRWLIFRADSNRLCRFLELSALGVRLAAEGTYHGKEGYLIIQSAKGLDFRRMLTPKHVFQRHSPKWFLVRHSYIVCVESPENMHIYDVYLVDPKFEIIDKHNSNDSKSKALAKTAKQKTAHPQHHTLKLRNSERKIKLLAKNERQLRQFEDSLRFMMNNTRWATANRFESFAPVRTGVFAQWLVDGRDYMWNVSRAISMAKDVIYIHDWWLSPQLYMRRPAAISQKWRLDRLLRKKAREGVKIFIIIYRNVEAAIPIDSEYTKFSMLDLHPNVFVQRSPNQFRKNQFFFAHHEKICIVDHTVAFVGGIDLCFGRWDTPQHSVVDDKPTGFESSDSPKDADHCQLWPGKDYSNPRVQDFFQLHEPYAEMYDRTKVPRMPWHDISMQVVGQPARDLTRHFVQRWNYVLRGRKPTRPTPFLLPPPDYQLADLESLGLNGTCEVQILRSASSWSLGIEETEHSIMNAYVKMIEESEHFVYMENQFFITSTETMNVKIVNKIGDAIVERAIRAYRNNESWRCVILIPLMPGFQNTVDEAEGTSVRLIMQCQFRSICRGETSIFSRLRKEGIEPEDFVQFYSLRAWGKIGPKKVLVTEQLYIHAKVIIVDDRIALIGSANINERSMLGNRDSECAAVVRDTDMLWSVMDGKPYLVGRFAHTLRLRLMREHLGIDVDEVMEEEHRHEMDREAADFEANMNKVYSEDESDGLTREPSPTDKSKQDRRQDIQRQFLARQETSRSFNHDADWEEDGNPNLNSGKRDVTRDKRVTGNQSHASEVDGDGTDHWKQAESTGIDRGRDSVLINGREVLLMDIAAEGKGTVQHPAKHHERPFSPVSVDESGGHGGLPPPPQLERKTTEQLGLVQLSQLPALPNLDDTDIGGPPASSDEITHLSEAAFGALLADIKRPSVDKDCMRDPLNDAFADDIWRQIADNNTRIFRRVFRCHPDSEVSDWHDYKEYVAYAERFAQSQGAEKSGFRREHDSRGKSGPPGAGLIPLRGSENHPGRKATDDALSATSEKKPESPELDDHSRKDAGISEKDMAYANGNGHTHNGGTNGQTNGFDEKRSIRQVSQTSHTATNPSEETDVFPPLETQTTDLDNTATKKPSIDKVSTRQTTFSTPVYDKEKSSTAGSTIPPTGSVKRRRRATTRGSRKGLVSHEDLLTKRDAEKLLGHVQGNLVLFPYDWLVKEELNSNWLYQVDQVAPLQIYD